MKKINDISRQKSQISLKILDITKWKNAAQQEEVICLHCRGVVFCTTRHFKNNELELFYFICWLVYHTAVNINCIMWNVCYSTMCLVNLTMPRLIRIQQFFMLKPNGSKDITNFNHYNYLAIRRPQLGWRRPKANSFWTLTKQYIHKVWTWEWKWLIFQIIVGKSETTDVHMNWPRHAHQSYAPSWIHWQGQ